MLQNMPRPLVREQLRTVLVIVEQEPHPGQGQVDAEIKEVGQDVAKPLDVQNGKSIDQFREQIKCEYNGRNVEDQDT